MNQPATGHKMNRDVFDAIREDFAAVARAARQVTIRTDRIAGYVLAPVPPEQLLDDEHHYSGDAESTAAYILTLEAVNFGSGYKPALAAEGSALTGGSIYFTVSTQLKDRFERAGAMTPEDMSSMTIESCARIFRLNIDGAAGRELATRFRDSLNELGKEISCNHSGSFAAFVEAADGSAARFVTQLAKLPGFNDIADYHGRPVHFYKRAQHAAASLQIAFARMGRNLFTDTDRLTMFADNAVPHILRVDGILEYGSALSDAINAGTVLPSGSEAEIEIRACAGHAVELIAAASNRTAMDIDHMLWHRKINNPGYARIPSHRTPGRFY